MKIWTINYIKEYQNIDLQNICDGVSCVYNSCHLCDRDHCRNTINNSTCSINKRHLENIEKLSYETEGRMIWPLSLLSYYTKSFKTQSLVKMMKWFLQKPIRQRDHWWGLYNISLISPWHQWNPKKSKQNDCLSLICVSDISPEKSVCAHACV